MTLPAIHRRLWHAPALAAGERDAARWLSSDEREVLAELRDPARRTSFLAGRILVKRIILEEGLTSDTSEKPVAPAEIDIVSRDGLGRSVQPRVFFRGQMQPWNVSLAHAGAYVQAAVAASGEVAVGVDLVPSDFTNHERLHRGLAQIWLTPDERAAWATSGDEPSFAKRWALKEAVYKALSRGAPFVPASIEILPAATGWTWRYRGIAPRIAPQIEFMEVGNHFAVLVAVNKPTPDFHL